MKHLATTASSVAALLALGSVAQADIRVCNEFVAAIHVALAKQEGGSYTVGGWWTVPKNSCQDVDFTLEADTLYYAADSDDYRSGRETRHDHWGNKIQLFVGSRFGNKFNFANADKGRAGAKPEMFSSATMTQQSQPKAVAITVHFKQGGTSIDFTPR